MYQITRALILADFLQTLDYLPERVGQKVKIKLPCFFTFPIIPEEMLVSQTSPQDAWKKGFHTLHLP